MARTGQVSKIAAFIVFLGLGGGLTGCVGQNCFRNDGGSCGSGTCGSGGSCGSGGCGNSWNDRQSVTTSSCGTQGCTTCRSGNGNHPRIHGAPYGEPNLTAPVQSCPAELTQVTLPAHKIAAPDVLVINALRMVPRPPYRLEPMESLIVSVTDTLPNQPISGPFTISLDGTINLGYSYGIVRLGGYTPDQAQVAIRQHLGNTLKNPQVNVALPQFRGMEQIRGEHLVRPDGTVSLGTYGSVYVAGLSIAQAKCVIERHLSEYLLNPQVSLDVLAYNSRVYYVIIDGAGFGQKIFRMPSTGNETVLDAISQIQGIDPVSSKRRIWIARPAPANMGCNQILPVDWRAITEGGSVATNYQLFPGDRVYVGGDRFIETDNFLSKVFAPVERVFGIMLLGKSAFSSNQTSNGLILPR